MFMSNFKRWSSFPSVFLVFTWVKILILVSLADLVALCNCDLSCHVPHSQQEETTGAVHKANCFIEAGPLLQMRPSSCFLSVITGAFTQIQTCSGSIYHTPTGLIAFLHTEQHKCVEMKRQSSRGCYFLCFS